MRVERWLEKNRRTWRAPDFVPRRPSALPLPVWLDLREDDTVYGFDDQGDVNPYDARNALARGYTPGTVVEATTKGGEKHRGRLGKDGDDATVTLPARHARRWCRRRCRPSRPRSRIRTGAGARSPSQDRGRIRRRRLRRRRKPDLIISELGINDFTVKNQGAGPAGAFMVTVVGFGTYNFNGLAPGESATRTYSNGCNPSSEVRADSLFQVDESDETNNIKQLGGVVC